MLFAERYKDALYYDDIFIGRGLVIRRTKSAMPCKCFIVTEFFARKPGHSSHGEKPVCSHECPGIASAQVG